MKEVLSVVAVAGIVEATLDIRASSSMPLSRKKLLVVECCLDGLEECCGMFCVGRRFQKLMLLLLKMLFVFSLVRANVRHARNCYRLFGFDSNWSVPVIIR